MPAIATAGATPLRLTGKSPLSGQWPTQAGENADGYTPTPCIAASRKSDSSGAAGQCRATIAGIPDARRDRHVDGGSPRGGRYGQRDAALILIGYRHGLRAVEIADLEWPQVEFGRNATLHVRRAKNGKPSAHPLRGDEIRALRDLQRQANGGFVFETERGGPFTPDAVNRLIKRIGQRAGLPFPVHAHMLRHGCGYALVNAGHDTRRIQDWLGHRSIQHTTRYTELSGAQFKNFWR